MATNFKLVHGTTTIEFDAVVLPINITRRRSQNFIEAIDTTVYVYDRGFTITFFAFKVSVEKDGGDFADITTIEDFIENEAKYRLNVFELHPANDIDLGAGDGVKVDVRYWGDDLKEIQSRTQMYDYDFFFRKEN